MRAVTKRDWEKNEEGQWVMVTQYWIDGVKVSRAEYDARIPSKPIEAGDEIATDKTTTWPMESTALAVHGSQVEEANERAKRHGINVHYEKSGQCVIPDKGNYRKLLKLEGYFNKGDFC